MSQLIYLDYAATTPVDPDVAAIMCAHLTMDGHFANPASRSHMLGWQAEAAVEKARKQVAELLNADTREIIWTSGATEANNLAIKGAAEANPDKKHIVSSATEHKAVLDCLEYLRTTRGFEITLLKPEIDGRINPDAVLAALRPDTLLVSIMHVNNETGAINDIEAIGKIIVGSDTLFHVDAAQSAGKLPLDPTQMNIDLLSVCAHKIYGPKGIGALFILRSPNVNVAPQIHGGGHERGYRSGTLATHQIAGMGKAFELAKELRESEQDRIAGLRAQFNHHIRARSDVVVNGTLDSCIPGILNVGFPGIDGQLLLSALPRLAISSGSACTSATMAPSHVLTAMGLDEKTALSALRFSFGRYTTSDDVDLAAQMLLDALDRLKGS